MLIFQDNIVQSLIIFYFKFSLLFDAVIFGGIPITKAMVSIFLFSLLWSEKIG